MRHFLNLFDLTRDEILMLLQEAERMKTVQERGQRNQVLAGRVLGMVFEKPSLRTRASFETAMAHLGGASLFLPGNETGLGSRESVPDFARTLSQYVDAVVLRTFAQETIETFAAFATCPVINGLSDYYHPCQALGDLLTVQELFGKVTGRTVVFVGDGNNVARSLAVGCGKLGARFVLAAPDGYGFDEPFLRAYRLQVPGGELLQNGDPRHAVGEADVIYTDVWTSMGQDEERERRLADLAGFGIDDGLLKLGSERAIVLHCLPAHYGEEITEEVLYGPRSAIWDQAENRLHAQKALLALVIR